MRIQIIQDIIDVIRGQKKIVFVDKYDLKIPKEQRKFACYVNENTIFCKGYKNGMQILKRNKKKMDLLGLYSEGNKWVTKKDKRLVRVYKGQKKFLDKNVIPILRPTDSVCDVGCASGEFTFMFPKHCKEVDGLEYFKKYVDSANKTAKKFDMKNIKFYQCDINNYNFEKKYNHILLMGLLPHIFENDKVQTVLQKTHDSLEDEGYLTIKCNVTTEKEDYFKIRTNHTIIFHSLDKLKRFIEEAGFTLVCEDWARKKEIKLPKMHKTIEANHWMALYQKTR